MFTDSEAKTKNHWQKPDGTLACGLILDKTTSCSWIGGMLFTPNQILEKDSCKVCAAAFLKYKKTLLQDCKKKQLSTDWS